MTELMSDTSNVQFIDGMGYVPYHDMAMLEEKTRHLERQKALLLEALTVALCIMTTNEADAKVCAHISSVIAEAQQ